MLSLSFARSLAAVMPKAKALARNPLNRLARRRLRAFGKAKSGIAATEFALVVPLMLTMYFGMVELTQALGHARKSVIMSRTLADLVTQSVGISDTDMNTIFTAARSVMAPYPDDRLAMRVTSVMIDGAGTAWVEWSDVKNNNATNPYSQHARCALANSFIPASLRVPRTYLVWSEVTIQHIPTIGHVVAPNGFTMTEKMPMRPRVSTSIGRQNVPGTSCPAAVP
ncbi:MAG TPA: pilus assembly protein [Beijerinckiaceae bacterium]|nr:pilus assembly protein [Beijerinckiaceae bacterium]